MSNNDWDEEKTVFGRFGANGEAEPEADPQAPKAIFRLEAIRHHLAEERRAGPMPQVPLWAGTITWIWVTLILAAITLATTVMVETTVAVQGIVQEGAQVFAVLAKSERGTASVGEVVRIEADGQPWSEATPRVGKIIQMADQKVPGRVQIEISVTTCPGDLPLALGMPVRVRLVTGRTTPAAILLAPIARRFK